MQKVIPFDDILVVLNQAKRDGATVARNHLGLNVKHLKDADIETYGKIRAEDAWRTIQLSIRPLHIVWTGHKPQFVQTYISGFLLGYNSEAPNAYELYLFPETVRPALKTTRQHKKWLRKQQSQKAA